MGKRYKKGKYKILKFNASGFSRMGGGGLAGLSKKASKVV